MVNVPFGLARFKIKIPTAGAVLTFFYALWFVAEFCFVHTLFSQIALFLFVAVAALVFLTRLRASPSLLLAVYLLFCFVAYLNIRLGYSIAPAESRDLLSTLLLNFVFFVALDFYYAQVADVDSFAFYRLFVALAVVVSVVLAAQNLFTYGTLLFREDVLNPNAVAILDAYAVFLLIVRGKHRFWIAPLTVFIILSGTRKAVILLAVAVVLYYCFKYPKRLPKYVALAAALWLILWLLFTKVDFLYETIGHRMEALFRYLSEGEGDNSILSRAEFAELGIRFFRRRPWLGNGINCFHTLHGAYDTYSHNNFVELLFSVGVIGFAAYYLMYAILIFRALWLWWKTRNECALLALCLSVSTLVIDYAIVSYYSRSSLFILFLSAALCRKCKATETATPEAPEPHTQFAAVRRRWRV